jgi:hypothetical protein
MYSPSFNPMPFGPVTVATPGTLVRLAAKLIALGTAGASDAIAVNKISVIAIHANIGAVYLGIAGMNRATLQGVIYAFQADGIWEITNNEGMDTYRFDQLWVDADNATDGVYGAIDQV